MTCGPRWYLEVTIAIASPSGQALAARLHALGGDTLAREVMMRRLLPWFPVAWAAGVYVVMLWVPTYSWERSTQTAGGAEIRTAGRATFAAVNGPRVYLILAVPVVAAALAALPWPARFRQPAAVAGTVIVGAFAMLGMASVGMFFLPSVLGLFALATAVEPSSRPAA